MNYELFGQICYIASPGAKLSQEKPWVLKVKLYFANNITVQSKNLPQLRKVGKPNLSKAKLAQI